MRSQNKGARNSGRLAITEVNMRIERRDIEKVIAMISTLLSMLFILTIIVK